MSTKTILAAVAALSLISCSPKETSKYAQDTFMAGDGKVIEKHTVLKLLK